LDQVVYLLSAGYPRTDEKDWDYAVVTFDGFHELLERLDSQKGEEREKSKHVMHILLEWIARNTYNTHFIFAGENYIGEELLLHNPAFQSVKINHFTLTNLTDSEARNHLSKRLHNVHYTHEDLTYAVTQVDGRPADLEALRSRVSVSTSVKDAADHLVRDAVTKIRNEAFGGQLLSAAPTNNKWTQVQLWKCIKKLVDRKEVPYDEVLFDAFYGDNEALQALVKQKILSVERVAGVKTVLACSPVFQRAFEQMVNNSKKFSKGMNIMEKKADITKDMIEMDKVEQELSKLRETELADIRFIPAEPVLKRKQAIYKKMLVLSEQLEKKEDELLQLASQK